MMLLRLAFILAICTLVASPLVAKDEISIVPSHHIVFPDIEAGTEMTLTIRVENRDNEKAVELVRITVEGGDSQSFSFGPLPDDPIEPHRMATFTATFRPSVPGVFDAGYYLHFRINGRMEKRSFDMHGTARPPQLRVSPEILDFGTVSTATLYTANVVVSNRGRVPAAFLGAHFPPGNEVFTFESSQPGAVIIPSEGDIRVTFGFRPVNPGSYETWALLRTGGAERDLRIRIRGRFAPGGPSPQPNIEVLPVELNFGVVTTATVLTDVITVSNTTGTADAIVTGIQITDPAFSLERWDGPVVVTAGTRVQFPVSFRPQEERDYETTAIVQTTEGPFPLWLVGSLKGPGPVAPFFTASLSVPDVTANVGEEFFLPFILGNFSADASVASCRVVLRFNSTLMTPRTAPVGVDSISGGMRTLALEETVVSLSTGSTVFSLPMIAALGDAETTQIDILAVDWLDAGGDVLDVKTETQGGQLTIGDIWKYGGVRLVNSNAGTLAMEISPNPVSDKATFRMSYQEPATLVVYDVMGNTVMPLTDVLPAPNLNPATIQVDITKLSAGTYYCRLSSGKFSLVRTMRIE